MRNGFPKNFLWGGAMAASQADGAYDQGGKGLDTQDLRYFDPAWTKAERAAKANRRMSDAKFRQALADTQDQTHYPFRHGIDFYNRWRQDLELFDELGIKVLRTSINWARIYPHGDDPVPNEEGLRFYIDLFDECHRRGIKVFATILHYNIPVDLVLKYGGWKSRKTVECYVRYARTLFERLGDRVDYWLPFNEFNAGKFNPYNGVCLVEDQEEDYNNAIFQCLQDAHSAKTLEKILLTASGGPFFGMTTEELRGKTKADALRHPNWNMGAKITIDSATLMNKGLELIEAAWLFGLPEDKIQIVVQRESIIHSAVQFADHSIIAQLGVPDMRIPIQYALTWPERLPSPVPELDFAALTKLSIATADEETFRCLAACKKAIRKGGLAPCAANGANEAAVAHFLRDEIGFLDIGRLVEGIVDSDSFGGDYTLADVHECDRMARAYVEAHI